MHPRSRSSACRVPACGRCFATGGFVPRLMLPLSLSYDHRVIDGANGARFTSYLASVLADAHGLLEAVP